MSAPAQSDYAEAVQNPRLTFGDARLQASRPALTKLQTPHTWSGGFAIAFHLEGASGSWAVRCFTHDASGLADRYSAISRFIGDSVQSPFVPIQYIAQGIRVGNSWWPVTLMPWVAGQSLNEWIQDHLGDSAALSRLRTQFKAIADGMEVRRMAHGDLQHGNILVRADGQLILIDYDGMYVPELAGTPMPEGGHLNYQHPDRSQAKFGPDLDRFSLAIIWSAIEILEHSPHLWNEFDNGENLLFLKSDFMDPSSSPLFRALRRNAQLAVLADRVERLALARVGDIPNLADVIAGKLPQAARSTEARIAGALSQYQIVDLRRGDIELYEGDRVTVVGEVLSYYTGRTVRGDPYAFVTLGSAGTNRLKIVVWSQILGGLGWAANGPQRGSLASVTGLITRFKGELQFELERPALFEAISGDRAAELVGSRWRSAPPTYQRLTHPRDGDVVLHAVFGEGEVLRSRNDVATVRFGSTERDIQFTKFEMLLVSRKPRRAGIGGTKVSPSPPLKPPSPKRPTGTPPSPPVSPKPAPVQNPSHSTLARGEAQALNTLYGGSKTGGPTKLPPVPSPPPPARSPAAASQGIPGRLVGGVVVTAIGAGLGLQVWSLIGAIVGGVVCAMGYLVIRNK